MTYKTSLDNSTKITTTAITILFAVIIITQFLLIKAAGTSIPVITSFALLLIYFAVFLYRPVNYILADDEIIIKRTLGDVKIKRSEIKTVQQLERSDLAWSLRIFGVGGLFGYWGKFSNKKMGTMTWYSTRKDKAVLIETINNKKVIITPDEPQQFVNEFNS